jgi:hypothetical protein
VDGTAGWWDDEKGEWRVQLKAKHSTATKSLLKPQKQPSQCKSILSYFVQQKKVRLSVRPIACSAHPFIPAAGST